MNILIVSRGFPSPKDILTGNFEADQARALQALGHKVVVVSVDRRLKAKDRHIGINHRIVDGINIYNFYLLPLPIRTFYKLGYYYITWAAQFLSSIILRHHDKPDIIHAHYLFTMPIALKLKEMFNVPCVGTEHWSYLGKNDIPPHVKFYANRVYHKLNALITVSNSLRINIKRLFDIDGAVIPNMFDDSKFNISYRRQSNTNKNKTNFISVGSLVDGKCFDLLLKAFSKLSFKDKHLIIIGDGPKRHELENMIKELGLESTVEMTGNLSRDEILPKYHESDVFVLPSNSETFGVVYIEAMASGLPVIATRCGGPEDFVDNSNGLLIDINSEEQLINAMEYMHLHSKEYNPECISKDIVNKYAPDKIARQIECLYNKILNCQTA